MIVFDDIAYLQQGTERQQAACRTLTGQTEPAFAQLLGLTGDPYKALLAFKKNNPTI